MISARRENISIKIIACSNLTTVCTFDNVCDKSFISTNSEKNCSLQSLNFTRSIDSIGSFSFTFAENINTKSIIDKIHQLDIVLIESDEFKFEGVITTVSLGAIADRSRTISINGKSSECLFDMLNISIDNTAMTFFLGEPQNIKTTIELCKVTKDGTRQALDRDNLLSVLWNNFCGTVNNNKYEYIASSNISKLIMYVYQKFSGDNFKDLIKSVKFWDSEYNFDVHYPVASQLFQNSNVKFIDYLRNILPTPIYEIYNYHSVDSQNPQMIIRKVPFDKESWGKLPLATIDTHFVLNYSIHRSIDEVYTAFFPYLQGSVASPDFYKNLSASISGSKAAAKNLAKISYYGYKPLVCNFVGFPVATSDKESSEMNNSISEKFQILAKEMMDMFGNNDEMYSGDITVVGYEHRTNDNTFTHPHIGGRVNFGGMQFYVTAEKVQWTYLQPLTTNYTITRGGQYSADGTFSPLKDFNEFLAELNKN